ncbi:CHAT domain-containing protein [Actinokineospora diospyrosa]|uniref:CHAT domain-containing protein n=1 Tax=Actinokineospora diospyrosa TaxID=103728 RepID=A0ABT1IC50_9PSEU|nr:CHAT domain-containing protein [Actinokineospora diospyrosa]MCP2269941.1 CHAT domain-containing protein [Actinokineospora diospyrosa]
MSDARDLDAVIDELDRRVGDFGRDSDPATVLDEAGSELLAHAWELARSTEISAWTAFVLARFHWCRYIALPDGHDQRDFSVAVELFTELRRIDPDAVPPPILDLLRSMEDDPGSAYNDSGARLYGLFEETGDGAALDDAITMFTKALAACPADAPNRGWYLSNASGAHLSRFDVAGDPADLDTAIGFGAQAAAAPGADENRAAAMSNYAIALRTRHEVAGALEDLEAAIDAIRAAIGALPAGHPHVNGYLSSLATTLRTRFERSHQRADIDEALATAQRALDTAPPDDAERPSYLSSLSNCGFTRYDWYRDVADLDLAIAAGRAAVQQTPIGAPERLKYLSNLGNALREQYVRTGSLDDLTAGIAAAREAVAEAPPRHSSRSAMLSNLAGLLRTKAARTGTVTDIDEAVAAAREAAEAEPGGPNRPTVFATYAAALLLRFERVGDPADLDAAIVAATTAVETEYVDDRGSRLSELSSALLQRYVTRGDRADLDAAVQTGRDAVTAASGTPDLARLLSNLAYTLRLRAEVTDDTSDLDDAVTAGQAAVDSMPPGQQGRAGFLVNLSSALAARFLRTGRTTDLHAAVGRSREALTQLPDDHADVPGLLNLLGLVLSLRFERTGRLADVDEAVVLARRAVAMTPGDHPERSSHLGNLAAVLRVRFRRTAVLADLDEAVEVGRAAVAAMPEAHSARGGYLSNLGIALRSRFEAREDPADLEAAIEASSQAVELTEAGANRAQYLSNLSGVLLSAFEYNPEALEYIDAMVAAAAEAVDTAPADHVERGRYLANLGNALITRGKPDDLARAVEVTAAAVRVTPVDDPDHVGFLFAAGHARHTANPTTGIPEEWRTAARSPIGAPDIRLRAAWIWGDTAASLGDPADAAEAFALAVSLLPVLAWRGLDQSARERHLWHWSGLASDACALALRAGDPRRAVEVLEQGRSVTWNQVTQTRADLTAARAAAPALVDRLDELRAALDAPEPLPELAVLDRERLAQARRRLAEEWDEVVDRVRALDGFASFLAAEPYEDLAAQAAAGPVVIVNLSRHGCAAIVVTHDEPVVVDLPDLSHAAAVERANLLLRTRGAAEDDRTFANLRAAHKALLDVLAWTYDTIVEPVLARCGAPRLWWCPTGPLTMLPLHAAGHYTPERTVSALDDVVSSYLPTISTLRRARAEPSSAEARALVVDQSSARHGLPPLPFAAAETGRVRAHLPVGTTLTADAATADAVLAALATHPWAHLSCHGAQHPIEPATSALYLYDRPLSVVEIARHRFPAGQLAYLSACETSTGGVRVLDEAMHLSAAFQVAGFRHVIATLWTIPDDLSMTLAADVYSALTAGGVPDADRSARALRDAVQRLRAQFPHAPLSWASFVHSGP